ncbi:MAG: ADP-ribosylglycohydrolase family protein [Candidatus Binatus sp.]|uniref:ADP-ribosylglycohydrolase family protein n=1 Tax=Candidatus Binatus sp. TaxID=2811406 RepID=UPI002724AE39|nr:ADP-ribosylglycohydrolase family protein [Candidatus Binatus sp.]MDO8433018.1 ADP-ribosylglycohydrolase family protein [Candidatus Binatus sp.]
MSSDLSPRSRILGGLWGVAVGDALGVPVEFCSRGERDRDPVTDLRGHGTHNQPPGTWSDDTSLTLCTVETLLRAGEDYQALGQSFVRWLDEEIWTPHGRVFDVGNTTAYAIRRLSRGVDPLKAGRDDDFSNGNGSLMRILPVAIWFTGRAAPETIEAAHRFSALTHRHERSQAGCAIFCLIAQHLIAGAGAAASIDKAWKIAKAHYRVDPFASELRTYARIASAGKLKKLDQRDIRGSGYVIDALEASLWCLLKSSSFDQAVLSAVNLGDDTDTTAAITGALAGIRYGVEAIPAHWRTQLARHDDLDALFNDFVARIGSSA